MHSSVGRGWAQEGQGKAEQGLCAASWPCGTLQTVKWPT